jgi:hypothetical protein
MSRGAAFLCADNHLGIDAIIPMCYEDHNLSTKNVTPLLLQFKNVKSLTKPRTTFFANMDPRHVGVFDKGSKGKQKLFMRDFTFLLVMLADHLPVIKLVLSVGSKSSLLRCAPMKKRQSARVKKSPGPSQFALFAGGLSHETFKPIQERNEATWHELVSRSGVEDIYSGRDREKVLGVVRRMTPCAQSDPGHWAAFFPLGSPEAEQFEDGNPNADSDSDEWT